MPGWHEKTETLRNDGELSLFGVVQEQHPNRARLFMQWKQMDWPVAVDSFNRLGVKVVPIAVAVDEHGVVRHKNPSLEELRRFVDRDHDPPPEAPPPAEWEEPTVSELKRAVAADPEDATSHFRLGVALRRRYESADRQPEDFRRAGAHWTRAVELDPNNYIWRRRVQQYGPRLDKPYPFYDWVERAREEIEARGEEPVELRVEPGGAELAHPAEELSEPAPAKEPDPDGRVRRDEKPFVEAEVAAVPSAVPPGGSTRVHLDLRPNRDARAHWNNEAEETLLWVAADEPWGLSSRLLSAPLPPKAVSREPRSFEIELRAPDDARPGETEVPAYVLYYVCEDVDGTCLYRRQDVPIELEIRED